MAAGNANTSGLNQLVGNSVSVFADLNKVAATLVTTLGVLAASGVRGARLGRLQQPGSQARSNLNPNQGGQAPGKQPPSQAPNKSTSSTLLAAGGKMLGAAAMLIAAAKFLTAEPKVQNNTSALNEMASASLMDRIAAAVKSGLDSAFGKGATDKFIDDSIRELSNPGKVISDAWHEFTDSISDLLPWSDTNVWGGDSYGDTNKKRKEAEAAVDNGVR